MGKGIDMMESHGSPGIRVEFDGEIIREVDGHGNPNVLEFGGRLIVDGEQYNVNGATADDFVAHIQDIAQEKGCPVQYEFVDGLLSDSCRSLASGKVDFTFTIPCAGISESRSVSKSVRKAIALLEAATGKRVRLVEA